MTAIVKKSLGYVVADSILNDIRNKKSRYYYFLSKTSDNVGVPKVDSIDYELEARRETVLLKAITSADVCLVAPRINWNAGTTYAQYSSSSATLSNFYCLTAAFNVYKCIRSGIAGSQFEPVGTGIDVVEYPDGYSWKFLYNIPLALRNKFLTYEYMPVVTSLTSRFFSNGSIDSVAINANGAGYTQSTTTIAVNGNGTGARFTPVIQSGQLIDVVVDDAGSGYSTLTLEVESTRTAVTPALITPNLTIGDVNTPQAIAEMLSNRGTVDSVTLTNPGSNYTTVAAAIVGDGTGAVATLTLVNGAISDIRIASTGYGYTTATVVISGDGIGASATAAVAPAMGHGRNAPEELVANTLMFYGALSREKYGNVYIDNDYRQYGIVRNPRTMLYGSNIADPVNATSYAVKIAFSGGATIGDFPIGAELKKTVAGADYTFTVQSAQVGTQGGVQQYALLLSGPGMELLPGDTLQLISAPTKGIVVQETRNQSLVDSSIGCTCYAVTGAVDVAQFPTDSEIINLYDGVKPSRRFKVVAASATALLLLPLNGGDVVAGNVLNKNNSAITFIATAVVAPNVDKLTGEVIMIDSRSAFNQTDDQTVTFRTLIKF